MILIFSQSERETSTDQIIDWIEYCNFPFKRLNGIDFYQNSKIAFKNGELRINVADIDWEKVKVVWLRRWISETDIQQLYVKANDESIDSFIVQLNKFIRDELKTLVSFFFDWLPKQKLFTRTEPQEINKLIVLRKALELKITIPDTFILSDRTSYEEEVGNKKDEFITKAISNAPSIKLSNKLYCGYTAIVDKVPEELDHSFFPSLFQSNIIKKYEIRTFLLSRKFYSMAIFSQKDPQTKLDFRIYNFDNPNRVVPYQLPKEIEEKLLALADSLELNTGSFDLIKTIDNQHVFLEVNPDGQFGMLSYPCNYHLEKKFATELMKFNSDAY